MFARNNLADHRNPRKPSGGMLVLSWSRSPCFGNASQRGPGFDVASQLHRRTCSPNESSMAQLALRAWWYSRIRKHLTTQSFVYWEEVPVCWYTKILFAHSRSKGQTGAIAYQRLRLGVSKSGNGL